MQKEKAFIDVEHLEHQRGSSMKIKVRNLGSIQETTEFDVKPLTIFIGPNNTGKTWLAHTLAAIFGEYGYTRYTQLEDLDKIEKEYLPLKEAVDHLLESGTSTINLLHFAKEYGEVYFNNLAKGAREWLGEFMGTKSSVFDQLEISVDLKEDREEFFANVLKAELQTYVGLGGKNAYTDPAENQAMLSFSKEGDRLQIHLYTFSQQLLEQELPREMIEKQLARCIFRILHRALYSRATILSNTRANTPLLSNAPLVISTNDEERKNRGVNEQVIQYEPSTTKNGFQIPTLPSNSFHYELRPREKREREKLERNTPEIREYIRLAKVLEETILGGTIKILSSNSETERLQEIAFQPSKSDLTLEFSVASSMVKELSSLVFYLRNFAIPGELLIIDEPETGLHPYGQTQMIEFLAMLVNAGLRVLVTTHSPYMIDHLTNLMLAGAKDDKESVRSEFFLQDTQAFISKDEVSVYMIDHNEVKDSINDEDLDWDTFGDVSNRITNIYFAL